MLRVRRHRIDLSVVAAHQLGTSVRKLFLFHILMENLLFRILGNLAEILLLLNDKLLVFLRFVRRIAYNNLVKIRPCNY